MISTSTEQVMALALQVWISIPYAWIYGGWIRSVQPPISTIFAFFSCLVVLDLQVQIAKPLYWPSNLASWYDLRKLGVIW
jgi:hypothetical protein